MNSRRHSSSQCSETRLLDLIHQVYEAAVDPSLWVTFLDSFAEAIHSDMTNLLLHDHSHRDGRMAAVARFDPAFQREYDEHYASVNIWKNRNTQLYKTGVVLNSSSMCSEADLEKSEWYADYLRRVNLYYSMGTVLSMEGNASSTLTTMRPKARGPFEDEDVIFRTIGPHVERALRIHRMIGRAAASYEALNAVPFGVVLFGLGLKMLFMNDRARTLLDHRDGLSLEKGQLWAATRLESKKLRHLLSTAALSAGGQTLGAGDYMSISRPSGNPPLQVLVTPVRLRMLLDPYAPAVLMIVSGGDQDPVNPNVLSKLFGLTRQEARLAALLIQRNDLATVAEELLISYETARKHLKSVFQKTGTRRQAELTRLIIGGIAALRTSTLGENDSTTERGRSMVWSL